MFTNQFKNYTLPQKRKEIEKHQSIDVKKQNYPSTFKLEQVVPANALLRGNLQLAKMLKRSENSQL